MTSLGAFEGGGLFGDVPSGAAGTTIDGDEATLVSGALGDEDGVAPDDGGGIARFRQPVNPADILRSAPAQGGVCFRD
jgi:hypothetical protein